MDRPVTPDGDGEVERALVRRFPGGPRSALADLLEQRTRWVDDVTLTAIGDGIGQIVLVAAGYDCRALRFRSPGVRFTELDHPDTQADKVQILGELGADLTGITFVAADFLDTDVDAALAAAGHDAGSPTLFVVEGLLIYLPEDVIRSLLTALRRRAAPASRMAVSISRPRSAAFRARVASVGEQALSTFDGDGARHLLQGCGWAGDTSGQLVVATPA